MSYEILEHTADAKFRATGKSLGNTFSSSVKAFAEIVGSDPEAGEVRHKIELKSEKLEALIYDFLHKLIMLQEIEDVAVCHAESLSYFELEKGHKIEATIWTEPIDQHMHLTDVKAPTYNEMKIDHSKDDGWIVEAVLDL